MYQKGDYINYGGHGICQIEDIRAMDFKTGSGKRDYYILHPICQDGTVFYLPADSSDTRSRRLLTREEIDGILTGIRDSQMSWIADRKQRTAQFQQILSRRDIGELVLLAKCLHLQQRERPLPTAERETLHQIEHMIEQEFSIVLGLPPTEVGAYIQSKMPLGGTV